MKLYWRFKKDGKWNWKPARSNVINNTIVVVGEEE